MKKTLAFLLSLTLVFSAVSCSKDKTSSTKVSRSAVTTALSEKTQLTNHMTEKERSKVSVGELTVFDHMQDKEENEAAVPEEGVCIEFWSEDDYIANWKKQYEKDPSILEGGSFEEAIGKSKPYFDDIYSIFVDGRSLSFNELFPIKGYNGGEIKLRESCPVHYVIDKNGNGYGAWYGGRGQQALRQRYYGCR